MPSNRYTYTTQCTILIPDLYRLIFSFLVSRPIPLQRIDEITAAYTTLYLEFVRRGRESPIWSERGYLCTLYTLQTRMKMCWSELFAIPQPVQVLECIGRDPTQSRMKSFTNRRSLRFPCCSLSDSTRLPIIPPGVGFGA